MLGPLPRAGPARAERPGAGNRRRQRLTRGMVTVTRPRVASWPMTIVTSGGPWRAVGPAPALDRGADPRRRRWCRRPGRLKRAHVWASRCDDERSSALPMPAFDRWSRVQSPASRAARDGVPSAGPTSASFIGLADEDPGVTRLLSTRREEWRRLPERTASAVRRAQGRRIPGLGCACPASQHRGEAFVAAAGDLRPVFQDAHPGDVRFAQPSLGDLRRPYPRSSSCPGLRRKSAYAPASSRPMPPRFQAARWVSLTSPTLRDGVPSSSPFSSGELAFLVIDVEAGADRAARGGWVGMELGDAQDPVDNYRVGERGEDVVEARTRSPAGHWARPSCPCRGTRSRVRWLRSRDRHDRRGAALRGTGWNPSAQVPVVGRSSQSIHSRMSTRTHVDGAPGDHRVGLRLHLVSAEATPAVARSDRGPCGRHLGELPRYRPPGGGVGRPAGPGAARPGQGCLQPPARSTPRAAR